MNGLVWVESWQVQSTGKSFGVGERVTWPCSSHLNIAAVTELVGSVTASQVQWIVDWHASRSEDTTTQSGIVASIVGYRSRLFEGRVVPGSVEMCSADKADGWESENDGLCSHGYLVTVADFD